MKTELRVGEKSCVYRVYATGILFERALLIVQSAWHQEFLT